MSKSETNPNPEQENEEKSAFGDSGFGFVSDFDIRDSDFPSGA
jgi:hypothetical protein